MYVSSKQCRGKKFLSRKKTFGKEGRGALSIQQERVEDKLLLFFWGGGRTIYTTKGRRNIENRQICQNKKSTQLLWEALERVKCSNYVKDNRQICLSKKEKRDTFFATARSQPKTERGERSSFSSTFFLPTANARTSIPPEKYEEELFFAGKATTVYRGEGGKLSNMQRGSPPSPSIIFYPFLFFSRGKPRAA